MHNRRFVRMVMFQVPQLPETPFHTADMLGVGVKSMNGSGGGCFCSKLCEYDRSLC
jgi:hypothetical protein